MTMIEKEKKSRVFSGRESWAMALSLFLLVSTIALTACSGPAIRPAAEAKLPQAAEAPPAPEMTQATALTQTAQAAAETLFSKTTASQTLSAENISISAGTAIPQPLPTASEEMPTVTVTEENWNNGLLPPLAATRAEEVERSAAESAEPQGLGTETVLAEISESEPPPVLPPEEESVASQPEETESVAAAVPGATVLNAAPELSGTLFAWLEAVTEPVLLTYLDGSEASLAAEPVLLEIASAYNGRLIVLKIDLQVMGAPLTSSLATTPTFIIYRSGVQRQSLSGFGSPEELYQFVNNALAR